MIDTSKPARSAVNPVAKQFGSVAAVTIPRVSASSSLPYPFNLDNLYPSIKPTSKSASIKKASPCDPIPGPHGSIASVRLARTYPNIELYAPVYPFNLDIYPRVVAAKYPKEIGVGAGNKGKVAKPSSRLGETRAGVNTPTPSTSSRKTHADLVAEVFAETGLVPNRTRKLHIELEAEVFPGGLPEAELASPEVLVTPVQTEATPETAVVPGSGPAATPLRRQRSGTIMRAFASESLQAPPVPQGAELGRSRSMLEARTKMFERTAPPRSQTTGPQGVPRTLVRQKSATFERAKSLFHMPEESQSEGSQTPPRATRSISKLDMSKFGFA